MNLIVQILGPFRKATIQDWAMIAWLTSPVWLTILVDQAHVLWSRLSS